LLSEYPKDQIEIILTTPRDLQLILQTIYKKFDTINASELLHRRDPELSTSQE